MVKKKAIVASSVLLAAAAIICLLAFPYAANTDPFDLSNFLTSFSIKDGAGSPIHSGDTVNIGESYLFTFTFAETAEFQFAYNGAGFLVFELPADILIPEAIVGQPIYSPSNDKIGEYSASQAGVITVAFYNVRTDGQPTPNGKNFIDYYTDAAFTLNVRAQFTTVGENREFVFGDNMKIVLKVQEPPPGLTATKTASAYDPVAETIQYTVEVTALGGAVSDIVAADAMVNGGWTFTRGGEPNVAPYRPGSISVAFDGVPQPAYANIPWNPAEGTELLFDFTGQTLPENRKIVIEYTVYLETYLDEIGVNRANYDVGSVDNTVTVTGVHEGAPVPPVSRQAQTPVHRKFIEKDCHSSKDGGNLYIIWQDTWVGDGLETLNGSVITDTLLNGLTFAPGAAVKVTLYDLNDSQLTARAPVSYSFGTTGPMSITSTGFSYTVPAAGEDVRRVAFEYETLVPPSGDTETYENTLAVAKGGKTRSVTKGMEIAPGFNISKRVGYADEDNLQCVITFTVPAGWQGQRFYLHDFLYIHPNAGTDYVVNEPENVTVTVDGAPVAPRSGTLNYRIATDLEVWQMLFGGGSSASNSVWPYDTQKKIVVAYTIPLTAALMFDGTTPPAGIETLGELLRSSRKYEVRNQVTASGRNTDYGQDGAKIGWPIFKRPDTAMEPSYIRERPDGSVLISYEVTLNESANDGYAPYGRTQYPLFKAGGPALFTDTFDDRLEYGSTIFRVYDSATARTYVLCDAAKNPIEPTVTNNGGGTKTLTVDFARLLQRSGAAPAYTYDTPTDPNWYAAPHQFTVWYDLRIPAEADTTGLSAYQNLAGVACDSNDVKGDFTDGAEVEYGRPVVQKEMDAAGNTASATIVINPTGKKLLSGSSDGKLEVLDKMNNTLALYLSSIKVYEKTGPGDSDWTLHPMAFNPATPRALWSYTVAGVNEITFILPDETGLKIVYEALIKGDAGQHVEIENYVEVSGGFQDSVKEGFTVTGTGGSGGGSRTTLMLSKNDAEDGSPLRGAEFALYMGVAYQGWAGTAPPYGVPQTFDVGGMKFYYVDSGATDAGGALVFDSPWLTPSHGAVYALVEYGAPSGYALPEDPVWLFKYTPLTPAQSAALGAAAGKVNQVADSVTLTNEPDGSIRIVVDKDVEGQNAPGDAVFTFKLTQLNSPDFDDVTPGGIQLAKSRTGPGPVVFSGISDLPDGTYYFKIEEVDGGLPGWVYDTEPRLVTIVINRGKVTVGNMEIFWTSGATLPIAYPNGNALHWASGNILYQQTPVPGNVAAIGPMWLTDGSGATLVGAVYCVDATIYAIKDDEHYEPAPGVYTNREEILWVVGNGFWSDTAPGWSSATGYVWSGQTNLQWMRAKYGIPGLTENEAYAATQAAAWYFANPDLRAVLKPNGTDPSYARIVSLYNQLIAGAAAKPVLSPAIEVSFDMSAAVRAGNYYGPITVNLDQNPAGFAASVPITLTPESGYTLAANTSGAPVPATVASGYKFYVNLGAEEPTPSTPLVKASATAQVRSGGRLQDAQLFFFNGTNNEAQPVCGIGVASDGRITVTSEAVLCAGGGACVVVFTNEYEKPEPYKTFVVTALKRVSEGAPTDTEFTFKLTQLNSDNLSDVKAGGITQTVSRAGPGLVTFGPFTITEPGSYYFRVEELNSGAVGWAYDDNAYVVEVIVTNAATPPRVIYPGSGGGAVTGTGSAVTSHAPVFTPPATTGSYKVTGQDEAIFTLQNESNSAENYTTACGFLGIPGPTASELAHWSVPIAQINAIRYTVAESRDNRESTLAFALERAAFGAELSLAEFNAFFGLNYNATQRYYLMQTAVWFFEFRALYPAYNWSMTNYALWPARIPESPGSTTMVDNDLALFFSTTGLPFADLYKALRVLSDTMAAYNSTPAGESVTALAMGYAPLSDTTGLITFAHTGLQPAGYSAALSWNPVPGLTVTVNGAPASPGVAVRKTDTILVTHVGSENVSFTLTDAQNYLVAGSVKGVLLTSPKVNEISLQSLLCGSAGFATLKCVLDLDVEPEDGGITFENKYNDTAPFRFTKTGKNGAALPNVHFALYPCKLAGEAGHTHSTLANNAAGCCWDIENPFRTAISDADGLVDFDGLPNGDYILVETRTQAGYMLPQGQWLIHVDTKASPKLTITARGDTLPPAFKIEDGQYSLPNHPQIILPKSGGGTVLLATALGAALLGAAGALWAAGRKKRRRRAEG